MPTTSFVSIIAGEMKSGLLVTFLISGIVLCQLLKGIVLADSWTTKADMLTARDALGVAVVNGKIYAIGGHGVPVFKTNEEYDPSTDTWTTKANMSTARWGLAAGGVDGKIYAIGGHNFSYNLTTNEEYDPSTDSWAAKSSMPTARCGLVAVVANGKIYTIGGGKYDGGWPTPLNTNEEYNPLANTWITKTSMPTERFRLAAAVVNGRVYAIGGASYSTPLNTNEEYDPSTDTWTTKANMPTARWGLGVGVVASKIYAIGGNSNGEYITTNEEYNPATDSWATKTPMPTARHGPAGSVVNDKIYSIGGWNGSSYLATNEEYTPDLRIEENPKLKTQTSKFTESCGLEIYPNPFSKNTVISYQLPAKSNVSLKVYNIVGELVTVLVDGGMGSGYYSFAWSAEKVMDGIYFLRLESNDRVITKKLVKVKQ